LEDILASAIREFSTDEEGGPGVDVVQAGAQNTEEDELPKKRILIDTQRAASLKIPRLSAKRSALSFDFEIGKAAALMGDAATSVDLASLETIGIEELIRRDFQDVVSIAASHVIARNAFLSDFRDRENVEALIIRFLLSLGAERDCQLQIDPLKLAVHIAAELARRYRAQEFSFESNHELTVVPIKPYEWFVPEDFAKPHSRVPVSAWKP
jgi:hypothetical protein